MNTELVLDDGLDLVEYNKELVRTCSIYNYMLNNIFDAFLCQNWYFDMYRHHVQTSIPQGVIKI